MPFRPVPKPKHKRRVPLRKYRNEFSPTLKDKIRSKFDYKCQECGVPAWDVHHVRKRSNSGRAVETNGLLLCSECHHDLHMHPEKERKWVEIYSEKYGDHFFKDAHDIRQSILSRELRESDREIERWKKENGFSCL